MRYCDDFVVLCRTEAAALESKRRLGVVMAHLHLRLHPVKTRIVAVHRGTGGFDFLGFHHRMQPSWRWRGRWYMHQWPSTKAMTAVRQKVRETLDRRWYQSPVSIRVAVLNRSLRGWGQYFRVGNSSRQFSVIDSYVAHRLALFIRGKHQLPRPYWGTARCQAHLRCIDVYRLTGTVRYQSVAHAAR